MQKATIVMISGGGQSRTLIGKGFTLAEVLITLGIIGVVAAMTLPSLINNTKGKELEAQYKKAYSIITQAVNRMNSEQGFIANWSSYKACTDEFAEVFNKYFIMAVNCGKAGCSTFNDDDGNYLTNYKSYTGKAGFAFWFDDGQFLVADSMFISVNHCAEANKILIGVDINGKDKKPNRYGQDFFVFQIQDDGKVLPMGTKGTSAGGAGFDSSKQSADVLCNNTSTSGLNGFTCAYKASTDKSFFSNLPK